MWLSVVCLQLRAPWHHFGLRGGRLGLYHEHKRAQHVSDVQGFPAQGDSFPLTHHSLFTLLQREERWRSHTSGDICFCFALILVLPGLAVLL